VLDAKGEPLKGALAQKPMVVKPNRGELEETVGFKIDSEDTLKDAMHRLTLAGPKWVVVTAGSAGTVVSDGKSFWRISTPVVRVVNPIGSGDSFAAGLMAGIVAGQSVQEACRLGNACGGANSMTSLAGHVNVPDVQALLGRIEIEPF
jgi:tagatose 6-phosphate kinase